MVITVMNNTIMPHIDIDLRNLIGRIFDSTHRRIRHWRCLAQFARRFQRGVVVARVSGSRETGQPRGGSSVMRRSSTASGEMRTVAACRPVPSRDPETLSWSYVGLFTVSVIARPNRFPKPQRLVTFGGDPP
jgi:hypothetical protein